MDRGKGITVRSGAGVQIDFMYRGQRCRESLKIKPTNANIAFAKRKREAILFEIASGKFEYGNHFPESKNALALGCRTNQTVGSALDAFVLSAKKRCAESTVRDYVSAIEFHLRPSFGDRLLSEITIADIKGWIGGLAISPKRINNVMVPLRGVLGDAFADGLIDRNPAAQVKNLRHRFDEPDPLTPDEIKKILDTATGQERNLFQFAICTGMRTSELIALEWGDIDWNKGVARVRRASVRKRIKVPKTQAGERDVKLLYGALEALQAQKPFTLLHGGAVFFNPRTGAAWLDDQQIRKTSLANVVKKAGIRTRPPYQTRHTFASLCLTAGKDIAWVAKQLGHKSISMTLKRYARFMDGIENSGGVRLTQLLAQSGHKSTANA